MAGTDPAYEAATLISPLMDKGDSGAALARLALLGYVMEQRCLETSRLRALVYMMELCVLRRSYNGIFT